MKRYKILSILLISIIFITQCTSAMAYDRGVRAMADPNPGYGAGAYLGTDPIGGDKGYSQIFSQDDADYVVDSPTSLINALNNAEPGEIVFVAGDINLTGYSPITIPEGVILAGDRGDWKGLPEGAMIYDDNRGNWQPFFWVETGARITGLRIRGPYGDIDEEEEYPNYQAIGIFVDRPNVEIDNCEIFNWPNAGIILCEDQDNADNFYAGAINTYIHHNTIHHCQLTGLGYGIALGLFEYSVSNPRYMGAVTALIEANLFFKCRHVVASNGNIGKEYEFCYNIISQVGESQYSHMIDVHGGYNRRGSGDNTYIANSWVSIHHNTFMPTDQSAEKHAVDIRGIPIKGGLIYHNWIWNQDPDMGIWQYHCFGEPGNLYVWNNRYGISDPPNISDYYHYVGDW